MEIKELTIRENKYYEAVVDGKYIQFSYDGKKIRGLWFDKKPSMALDTVRETMQAYNIAAEILKIDPIFKQEEINPDIIKVSHEFISDLETNIGKISSSYTDGLFALQNMLFKVNQVK